MPHSFLIRLEMGNNPSPSAGHFVTAAPMSNNHRVFSRNNTVLFDQSQEFQSDPKIAASIPGARRSKMLTSSLLVGAGESKKVKVGVKKSIMTTGFPSGLTSQDSLFVINNSIH